LRKCEEVARSFRKVKDEQHSIPYEIHPVRPGLLVLGSMGGGAWLHWLTDGKPEAWPLILQTYKKEWERLDMSVTTFLAKSFSCELDCVFWTKRWAKKNLKGVPFQPGRTG